MISKSTLHNVHLMPQEHSPPTISNKQGHLFLQQSSPWLSMCVAHVCSMESHGVTTQCRKTVLHFKLHHNKERKTAGLLGDTHVNGPTPSPPNGRSPWPTQPLAPSSRLIVAVGFMKIFAKKLEAQIHSIQFIGAHLIAMCFIFSFVFIGRRRKKSGSL